MNERERKGGKGMRGSWFVSATVVVTALSMLFFGIWARWDPVGFAGFANWPNHVHFLHDAGVFQIGIGLTMLGALFWYDTIAVVLAGFVFTNTFHAANHVLDMALGGNPSDPWMLSLLSVVGTAGFALRVRQVSRRTQESEAIGKKEQA